MIDKIDKSIFTKYIKKCIDNEDLELECVFDSSIVDKRTFLRIVETLKSFNDFTYEETSLDIRMQGDIRLTIHGLGNIKEYCKTDSLDNIDELLFVKKKFYKENSTSSDTPSHTYRINNDDYDYRLNVKTEIELPKENPEIDAFLTDYSKKLKTFRYKKRYSFISYDKLFRFDITAIKHSKHSSKTFKGADILSNKEIYEVEIEYIGSNVKEDGTRQIEQFHIDLVNKDNIDEYISPYDLYFKTSPNPYGLITPIDLDILGKVNIHTDKLPFPKEDEIKFDKDEIMKKKHINFKKIRNHYLHKKVIISNSALKDKNLIPEDDDVTTQIGDVSDVKEIFEKKKYQGVICIVNYKNEDGGNVSLSFPINGLLLHKVEELFVSNTDSNGDYIPKEGIPLDPGYDPESSIMDAVWEGVFKDKTVKKVSDELKEIEENILMYKELISELDSDDVEVADEYKKTIKEFELAKKELEKKKVKKKKKKKKKAVLEEQGGGGKIPDWGNKGVLDDEDDDDVNILDYQLLSEKLYEYFIDHIYYILTLIHDTKNLMSNADKKNLLLKYKTLTNQKCAFNDIRLIIPQPVTLTLNDINPYNPDSILLKYAVTEKADGDRYILYIFDNHGYLLNSKKQIIDTGVEFPDLNKEYIFDGEYITKNIDNENIKLFMIFDVYYTTDFKANNYVHKLPFHSTESPCRYNIINDFKTEVLNTLYIDENTIEIDIKKYDFGKIGSKHNSDSDKYLGDCANILRKCETILTKSSKKTYRYHIDGLIFLPLFNSVKAKDNVETPDYIGGTWYQNFKWKPPEENTIDFQVRFVKEKVGKRLKDKEIPYTIKNKDGSEVIHKYKQLHLLVGYDNKDDKSIDICMKILGAKSIDKGNIIPFSPDDEKILHTTNIKVDYEKQKVICERDQLEIKDGDIVEMRYNADGTNHMIWEPLRIRSDKIKPQYFTAADNVWSTIKTPVTSDLICNKLKKKDLREMFDKSDNKYYISKQDNSITEPLRKLHNYIKSKLIVGVGSSFKGKINVLDISIGRGGDINKYIQRDLDAKFILGLDLSTNVEEACERYNNHRKDKPLGVFLIADTSQNFSKADCYNDLEGDDKLEKTIKHSETMLNILYNLKKPVPPEYKLIQKKYNNLALEKFHIISSQFTFHYYFKDEASFEGVMKNIKDNIAPKGYFIGCCYDGSKIFEALKDSNIEFKDKDGNLIYSIDKKYDTDDFTFNPDNTDNMIGQQIDVFMESIGQVISEYLVNFQFFRHYMEENGFKLVSPKVKEKYSNLLKQNNITDGFGDFEKVINNLPELADKDPELQAKGHYVKAMDILKDTKLKKDGTIKTQGYESLRQLSSFNKYFIFQKE